MIWSEWDEHLCKETMVDHNFIDLTADIHKYKKDVYLDAYKKC